MTLTGRVKKRVFLTLGVTNLHKKRNLMELDMGFVEANFVIIEKNEKTLWVTRGFEEQREYPIFLYELEDDETVMLGIPKTIHDFGVSNFIGSKVLKVSTRLGTYGMGGPGFFGLLCDTMRGHFWLTFTVWDSSEYIMMDDRVIECHPDYNRAYTPWKCKTDNELNSILSEAIISIIDLSDSECKMSLRFTDGTDHEIVIYRYSEKLPPMGNGDSRKPAFEEGNLSDYLLITYEGTVLQV